MIILNTNVGSMTEFSSRALINNILKVESLYTRKPDIMTLQEVCHTDQSKNLTFGYKQIKDSFANKIDRLTQKEQRGTKTFGQDIVYPVQLNIFEEIVVGIASIYLRKGKGRKRLKKVAIINAYRNFRIDEKNFMDSLECVVLKINSLNFNVFGTMIVGDMNMEEIQVSNFIEIDHEGCHRSQLKCRDTFIDKVLVSESILNLDPKIIIMNTCERKSSPLLGHKTLIITINETPKTNKIFITSLKKYQKNIHDLFCDKTYNELRSIMRSNSAGSCIDNILNLIKDSLDNAEIEIEMNKKLLLDDLDSIAYEKGPKAVKSFCRFYKNLKLKFVDQCENDSNVGSSPPLIDLKDTYEVKLNKVHRADENLIDDFINMFSVCTKRKIKAPTLSYNNFKLIINKINKTSTPWIFGISPKLLTLATDKSNNLLNLIYGLYTRSLETGDWKDLLNLDKVFFLYKKGDKMEPGNYRGITISNPVTKMFEQSFKKSILDKCRRFQDSRNYAYSMGKSTTGALIDLFWECPLETEVGNEILLLFTDFSSAFESVQSSLVEKIVNECFDCSILKLDKWIRNFSRNKRIIVGEYDNQIKVKRNVPEVGFPQGSIISPAAWLFQVSITYFEFDRKVWEVYDKFKFIKNINIKGFADDTIHQIVVKKDCHITNSVRNEVLTKVFDIFEAATIRAGGIINYKKTEKLAFINDDDFNLKTSTKWLGFWIKMEKKGVRIDFDKTLKDIRLKTLCGFKFICMISENVVLRRKIFKIFIEPIVQYHLVAIILSNNYSKSLKEMQVFQNNFLRKIARVGYYVKEDELHQMLKINKIQHKLERMVFNLWPNLKHSGSYVPRFSNQSTRNRNGEKRLEVKNPIDRLYWLKEGFDKENMINGRFLIEEFTIWQNEMWLKGQLLAAGIGI